MFDIGATELLLIIVVAVIVIGPKDMPMALRTAGRWIGKMRRMSNHLRAGLDTMVREAEMEDMQKEWDRRNAEIMAKHPTADAETGQLAHDGKTEAPADIPPPREEEGRMEPLPLFDDDASAEVKPTDNTSAKD